MKVFYLFIVIIFLGILDISCSSCKKEINSEQAEKTPVLQATQKKTAAKDTISSTTSPFFTSTTKDSVTGILYVTGNEPFTKLALYISTDTVFQVEADSSIKSQLWQLQGKRVSIIGTIKAGPIKTKINAESFHIAP